MNFGGIVCIDSDDFSVTSIWDIPFLDEPFASVAKAMSDYIKSNSIRCTFIYDHKKMGTDSNLARKEAESLEGKSTEEIRKLIAELD